jgi:Abnormal spindle-like microcephaly-assoc'd, ASPM-SPD-2-Hydin
MLSLPRLLIAVLLLTGVIAGATRANAASLAVTWNAPTTNADGTPLTDLAGYHLYLGTTQPACPGASFLTVPSPTAQPAAGQTVNHRVTGLNAGATYFVRVTAIDTSGNESACSPSASGVAQPVFSVTPTTATNFGSVTTGGVVDRTFTVQNTSTASISGGANVGAPFSIASGGSFSLSPGASHTVTVRFQPTSAGSFASNVNFTASGDTISRGVSGSATGVSGSATAGTTTQVVAFAWTVGQPLPASQTVTISGGSGTWFTQDTNPWADVRGGTWNRALQRMEFAATATTFTVQPSSGMRALAPGTYTEVITVTRGDLTTKVTARVTVTSSPTLTQPTAEVGLVACGSDCTGVVAFAWTVGQPLPASQTVTISGGSGTWFTQDTNPWADVTGGTWNRALQRMEFAATATTFTVQPSSGMRALAPGTYTEVITVTRGDLTTKVTARLTVAP